MTVFYYTVTYGRLLNKNFTTLTRVGQILDLSQL